MMEVVTMMMDGGADGDYDDEDADDPRQTSSTDGWACSAASSRSLAGKALAALPLALALGGALAALPLALGGAMAAFPGGSPRIGDGLNSDDDPGTNCRLIGPGTPAKMVASCMW